MAYPPGVRTRQISFGSAITVETAENVEMRVNVRASRSLVWRATGTPVINLGASFTSDEGFEQVLALPVTDQEGWSDGQGGAVQVGDGRHSHSYIAVVEYYYAGISRAKATLGPFVLETADTPVDIDNIIPVTTGGGATISIPDSWSEQINAAQAAVAEAQAAVQAATRTINEDLPVAMATEVNRPNSPFKTKLDATIATEAQVRVPPLVASALSDDDTVAAAASEAVGAALAAEDVIVGGDSRIDDWLGLEAQEWVHIDADSEGRVFSGVRTDGTHYFHRLDSPTLLADGGTTADPLTDDEAAEWLHVDQASTGEVLSGIRSDGTRYMDRLIVRELDAPSVPAVEVTRINAVAGFGDSMMGDHGGLGTTTPKELGLALGVPYFEGGRNGQTSTEVALRAGGVEIVLSFPNNTIPAVGQNLVVTVDHPSGTWKTGSGWVYPGAVLAADGQTWVKGNLSKSATEEWTFWRTPNGQDISVPPGARFRCAPAIEQAGWGTIMRAGRNNTSQKDVILRDYKAVRAHVYATSERPRFLALPLFNSAVAPSGSATYNTFMDINNALRDEFGPEFYDLRAWVIRHGLAAAGITPTPEDTAAIVGDAIPPSLAFDTTPHMNRVGRQIEGARLAYILRAKGWFA